MGTEGGWLGAEELAALTTEDTTAHRVWTGWETWIDRFGDDYLISDPRGETDREGDLRDWVEAMGLVVGRVFVRKLVKQPGESDVPRWVSGATDGELLGEVRERGLRFEVDFAGGYSVGLFCDQRENRARLEALRPGRVLNCFSYTCAFSVAAARAGAETVNIDLSKRALRRGRENFERNGFALTGHRFLADDVFAVLPRLARRGERFDAVILDPPTFSRDGRGRVFRVEEDFGRLVELAVAVCAEGAEVLLSSNSRGMTATGLRDLAVNLPGGRVVGEPADSEYPAAGSAVTTWVRIGDR